METVLRRGSVHSDRPNQVKAGAEAAGFPVEFTAPVTDHAAGDVLGKPEVPFWRDHQSAKVNGIRTETLLEQCDVAVSRFGDKYKQWNAALDAGYCAAIGTPYSTLHDDDIIHPLKEVDAAAMAWAQTPEQVVEVLKYVTSAR